MLNPDTPAPPRRRSTATTLLPLLPLLRLIPLAMAPRVKDRGVTVAAIVRTAEATVATAAAVAATLLIRATRASPALPWLPDPPSTILGLGPSTCTLVRLRGSSKTPSATIDSHHCAWPDHGRPSVHTTLVADPGSTVDVRH
jgi:hypothetical protein